MIWKNMVNSIYITAINANYLHYFVKTEQIYINIHQKKNRDANTSLLK